MAANGRIPLSDLTSIGGGLYLEHTTAVAWFAARVSVAVELGVEPIVSSPDGAYRDYAGQVRQKQIWTAKGNPNMAAAPGYSTHGFGVTVDINNIGRFNLVQLERIMAKFGFKRTIAKESWHFQYLGGYSAPAGSIGTPIEEDGLSAAEVSAIQAHTQAVANNLARDLSAGITNHTQAVANNLLRDLSAVEAAGLGENREHAQAVANNLSRDLAALIVAQAAGDALVVNYDKLAAAIAPLLRVDYAALAKAVNDDASKRLAQ